jgi:hypothetical protein
LPPQIAMAEQLGLRKIIEDRFKTLWWVPDSATPEVVHGYMRALDRAEQALEESLAKYLPLWKLSVPAEFESFYPWDFSKFGRGERFVNATLPREEFKKVFAQVERWGLDQYLKDRARRRFPTQPDYEACVGSARPLLALSGHCARALECLLSGKADMAIAMQTRPL